MPLRRHLAPAVLALVAIQASAAEPVYDVIPETADGTVAFVKERFPAGTPTQKVVDYLETQTFDCVRTKDAPFGDNEAPLKGGYVLCQRMVAYGFQAGKRWRIALFDEDKKVKDVRAAYALVGR